MDFLKSGGKGRKGLLIYGGIIGGLLVLSLIAMPFIWMATQGPGPNRANLGKVQTGMAEDQVDKLLGMPSNSDKKPDGSLVKTWKSQYAGNGDIHVTFVSGKATVKVMDEPPAKATPTEASEDNKPKASESFFDRHSGQYTVTIALPMGDLKLRFDVSGGSASNLEVESDGEWLKSNSSSPIRLVDMKTVNLDEAIVMVEIHGDKYPLGVGVHGTEIKGAVADSQHMYRVSGHVK
jgi:hypothetical protein